jgi:DNA-directed RNA polymerase subunit RPC12/RpoP
LEIGGLDTIIRAVGPLPDTIEYTEEEAKAIPVIQAFWNKRNIAIIPYCMRCKEPLNWRIPVEEDGVVLRCPNCGTKWSHE